MGCFNSLQLFFEFNFGYIQLIDGKEVDNKD